MELNRQTEKGSDNKLAIQNLKAKKLDASSPTHHTEFEVNKFLHYFFVQTTTMVVGIDKNQDKFSPYFNAQNEQKN